MTSMPKVTIAIPTYNRADFLRQALDSALAQSYPNIEVVVSDNASTDGTANLLASYCDPRLVCLHQERNLGMVTNWNACLSAASGDFFLLLSDDDLLYPSAIQKLIKYYFVEKDVIITAEEIGIVYCRSQLIDQSGKHLGESVAGRFIERGEEMILAFFQGRRFPAPCQILYRTRDIREQKGFLGTEFPLGADARAWMDVVLRRGYAIWVEEPLAKYRFHSLNISSQVQIDQWITEINALASFCVDSMCKSSLQPDRTVSRVLKAVRGHHARNIVGLIFYSPWQKKNIRNKLNQLFRYRRYFQGLHELGLLVIGLVKLVVPKRARTILVRLRHSFQKAYG